MKVKLILLIIILNPFFSHAQLKTSAIPVRLLLKSGLVAKNHEDSVKMTNKSILLSIYNMDCGNYHRGLGLIYEAIAFCPENETYLFYLSKLHLTRVNIQISNIARARKLMEMCDTTAYIRKNNYLLAQHYYNKDFYINHFLGRKANFENLNEALKLVKPYNDKAFEAKLYDVLSYEKNSLEEKIKNVNKAIEINTSMNSTYPLVENYITLANHYYSAGDQEKSLNALTIAESHMGNEPSFRNALELNMLKAEIMAANENYAEAYSILKSNVELAKKERTIIENISLVDMSVADLELNKKQKEIDHQQLKFSEKMFVVTLLIVICILVVLLVCLFFVLFRIRNRKRMHQMENNKLLIEKDNLQAKMELTNLATYLTSRNEIIDNVCKILNDIQKSPLEEFADKVKKLTIYLKTIRSSDRRNNQMEKSISELNKEFVERLCAAHPELTKNDKSIACLLRANLTTKQIATMLNISDASVNMARYRMRKNMNIGSEIKLMEYLQSL